MLQDAQPFPVQLPLEVLEELLTFFDIQTLARFSQCSQASHHLVQKYGWPVYARNNLFFHNVTNPFRLHSSLRWQDRIRIATVIDQSWSSIYNLRSESFHLFSGRTLPVLKLQQGRLIVAGGNNLSTFTFTGSAARPVEESYAGPSYYRDRNQTRTYHPWLGRTSTDIVTAIACSEDAEDFFVAHVSGLIQRCTVDCNDDRRRPIVRSVARYSHPKRPIQALDTTTAGLLVSATTHNGGTVSIHKSLSPWLDPVSYTIKTKPWSLMVQRQTLSPSWIAAGHTGLTPLTLLLLGQDGSLLPDSQHMDLTGNDTSTAVYDISSPVPSSPLGHPTQTLISGWYDGTVRIYDLRTPHKHPLLSLVDPYADDPVYSVASGGGAGCTVAAGTARYGLLRTWDVRKAKHDVDGRRSGHSLYAPGRDRSPVYGLAMEHDRLFGVTDKRAWMLEFGIDSHGDGSIGYGYSQAKSRRANHREGWNTKEAGRFSARYDNKEYGVYYYRHSDMKLRHSDDD